jgi:hypothetical protein
VKVFLGKAGVEKSRLLKPEVLNWTRAIDLVGKVSLDCELRIIVTPEELESEIVKNS